MTAIPREKSLDSTLAFLADGYTFISKKCGQLQSDVFETRLMLRKVICALGEDASAMFYHPGRFTRKGGAAADHSDAVAGCRKRTDPGWRGAQVTQENVHVADDG
jgi:hypothetical protein